MKLAEIALIKPIYRTYTYSIPEKFKGKISVGSAVLVPLKNRLESGIVLNISESRKISCNFKIKEIKDVIDIPPLTHEEMSLGKEIAVYFINPIGMALNLFLPPNVSGTFVDYFFLVDGFDSFLKDREEITQFDRKVILYLEKKGRVSLKDLKEKFSGAVFRTIKKCLKMGCIKRETVQIKNKKFKYRNYCEIIELPAEGVKITEKQRKVLEFLLKRGGPVLLSSLKGELGVGDYPIRSLEKKGFLRIFKGKVSTNFFSGLSKFPPENFEMTPHQKKVFDVVSSKIKSGRCEKFLLHGVTGSGKTFVYIKLVEECLKCGKSAVVLLPEISLTPQMAGKFLSHFGDKLAIFHSMLTPLERRDVWHGVEGGKFKVILGTRSALFLPVKNMGLIIVDEEHDSSYIQENLPFYSAVWVAERMADIKNVPLLLGSATPSVVNYFRAEKKELKLLEMESRVEERKLPSVEVVDMGKEFEKFGRGIIVSVRLKNAINEALKKGEQVILLLNRRGFSPFVICRKCGYVVTCKNCSISMTYHKKEDRMICHYCGYFEKRPEVCPECGSKYIYLWGVGTEKLESVLKKVYSGFVVERFDRDTTRKRGSLNRIIDSFRKGKIDILIGTQMVSKGHDFPNVTLVGVLSADMLLKIPRFDSAERTFQLLTQVAGRSGRGDREGKVIIQTYYPHHYAIKSSISHDFKGFYNREILFRKSLFYPPFSDFLTVTCVSKSREKAKRLSSKFVRVIEGHYRDEENIKIMGPVESGIEKIRNNYSFDVLIRILDKNLHIPFTQKIIKEIMQKDVELGKSLRFSFW